MNLHVYDRLNLKQPQTEQLYNNCNKRYMPAATPRFYFQASCHNMKYFGLYQHWTQAHFASVMLTMATRSMLFLSLRKRYKTVEILALLTTELSSYKMCKVGLLFCIHFASIYCKLQHGTLRESFLNVHWFSCIRCCFNVYLRSFVL